MIELTIRQKIRLLLGVVLIVMLVATVLRLMSVRTFEHALNAYESRAEQTIDSLSAIEFAAERLKSIAARLGEVGSSTELDALASSGSNVVDSTRVKIEAAPLSLELIAQMSAALSDIDGRFQSATTAARGVLDSNLLLFQAREALHSMTDQVAVTVPKLVTKTLLNARAPGSQVDAIISEIEPAIQLRVQFSSLIAALRSVSSDQHDLSIAERELEKTVLALSRLAPEQRAAYVSVLSDLSSALNAYKARAERREEALTAYSRALTATERTTLSELVTLTRLSGLAQGDATSVLRTQKDTEQRFIRLELGLFALLGFGSVIGVWIVFSRQVGHRIAVLSEDLLRVANGDLQSVSRVSGRDEIGKMANALEIFRRNAKELRQANADLESLTYATNHDLRSTLLGLRDLAVWTVEDHGTVLSNDVRNNLDGILARCAHMSKLLSDILDFARAGRTNDSVEHVELPSMIKDIAVYLAPPPGMKIAYSGPQFVASKAETLATILLNLLSNGVKHHDRNSGHVMVACTVLDSWATFEVSDDGPGIPELYQVRIFELFQTLDVRAHRENSGVGLAMSRKLAEQLGGTLSVSSNPNRSRGATFTLRIPVPEMHETDGCEDREGVAA